VLILEHLAAAAALLQQLQPLLLRLQQGQQVARGLASLVRAMALTASHHAEGMAATHQHPWRQPLMVVV